MTPQHERPGWREELDGLRAMLADAGRTGSMRDEVLALLDEVKHCDRIANALLSASNAEIEKSKVSREHGDLDAAIRHYQRGIVFVESVNIVDEIQ